MLILLANHTLLVSCLLRPSIESYSFRWSRTVDWRATLLLIFSFAFLARRPTKRSIPFVLTFLILVYTFPSSPQQDETAYVLELLVLAVQILKLHFPLAPSPILLFPNSKSFLLSGILWTVTFRIAVPAFIFFLPAFLLISFLLSVSLSDVFLWTTDLLIIGPAPINARVAFLVMLVIALVLFGCLATSLLLLNSSVSPPSVHIGNVIPWDSYTAHFGLQARQIFLDAITQYASPYYFPAPLNLVYIAFIGVPFNLLRLVVNRQWISQLRSNVEVILWRSIVLPFLFLIHLVWTISHFSTTYF